jgi:uncharacterized protein (TIGR03545 family)
MIRWKYVLPRLTIALIIFGGIRWGLDPLLKWALVAGGEAAVGAKVEIAAVETSLTEGAIELRGLTVANPHAAMSNLLEAEQASLQINMNALGHRRLVVENGILRGVQLGTARTTSGLLEKTQEEDDAGSALLDPLKDYAGQFASNWLAELDERLSKDFTAELKTLQVAQELEQRWTQEYEQLHAQAKSLRERGKALERDFRELRKNPLRNLAQLQEIQSQLAASQQELASLQSRLAQLPGQAETDRQAVLAARQADEQFIRQQLRITQLDDETLTQTLLGKPVTQGLASALDWLAWARQKIPSNKVIDQPNRSRGTNVLFSPVQPKYLVKQLRLEGNAQWGGQPLEMTGTLSNVCSEPQLLGEPTQLELQGTGAANLEISATLDRRTERAQDHLQIVCHEFALPGQTLGRTDKLALTISPSKASLVVDLSLDGDQLTGQIALGQNSVQFVPQQASLRNPQLVAALEQALGQIEQWEATVQLAGTLKKPQFSIESDLGQQVASGLGTALQQLMQRRADQLLAGSQQKVEAQLQKLQEFRTQAERQLLAKINEGEELFSQLASLPTGSNTALPIPRLSESLRLPIQRK